MLQSACAVPRVVHTIGHSTRTANTVLALLDAHAIACVADDAAGPALRRFVTERTHAFPAQRPARRCRSSSS